MRPPFYTTQLKRDLDMWIAKGLVQPQNRDAILESVRETTPTGRLETIIAVFGAILLGAGALSFVAANWADMDKAARLIVLFGSMWLAYIAAYGFIGGGRPLIGQAFVLLGVLLFGANIWLIAQTYNINSHWPDGLLLWGVGAIVAAGLANSHAALGAALLIGGAWTFQETTGGGAPLLHLPFLPYWLACAVFATMLRWRHGMQLAALALLFWLVISGDGFRHVLGWSEAEVMTIYILVPLCLWTVSGAYDGEPGGLATSLSHYGWFVFLPAFALLHFFSGAAVSGVAGGWVAFAIAATAVAIAGTAVAMQRGSANGLDLAGTLFAAAATTSYVFLVETPDDSLDIPYLVTTLVVILWSLARGARRDDRFMVNWSVVAFGAWVLYAYVDLFRGLMDQSLFFTTGGVLLILLALGLEPLRRNLLAPDQQSAAKGGKA